MTRRAYSGPTDGILYLIKFSNGILKPGYTDDFPRRLAYHEGYARRLDLNITNTWHSPWHKGARYREQRLLSALDSIGTRTVKGGEYFRAIPFTMAKHYAENFGRFHVPGCRCDRCDEPLMMKLVVTVTVPPVFTERAPYRGAYEMQVELPCGDELPVVFSDYNPQHPKEITPQIGDRLQGEIETQGIGRWIMYVSRALEPETFN